jgi:TetR/AcrR family transcriptional repressor of nem operon
MGRPSFRDKIVASGMQTVYERGFATAGLREITAAAGVAQGSFTNHFASKEEFGVAVLDYYFDQLKEVIERTLNDERRKPIERLRAYFDEITKLFVASGWRYGCLVGNMGLEAAEHSELIRLRLSAIFGEWTQHFARVVRLAQAAGEVRAEPDSEEVGAALMEAWQGAMLRMKIERTSAPLDRFKRLIFPVLLAAPKKRGQP